MTAISQLRRLGLFDARAPRYTSYPTANHFTDAVGPDQMKGWIGALSAGSEVSLYLHIPFCRRLCWFCACRTQGTATSAPIRGYLDVLKREIEILKHSLPDGVRVTRVHWGGGTPTLLEAAMITELAGAVRALAPLAEGGEFSVEIDPNEIDAARMDALMAAGMTRASIGVQDFDPAIQKTIGRDQSFEITKEVADALRARGIQSLNVDILYGLPDQTRTRIADSVQKVLTLNPDRIALYGYAHVPWMAKRQSMIPAEALPVPEERLELFETARKLFLWDGYEEIGIDHFARPGDGLQIAAAEGRLRRNFQGYTDDTATALIGLGASAISRFPQGFAQNEPSTSAYNKAIYEGRFATKRGHAFSEDDRIREAMIERLMCDFSITPSRLAETLGVDVAEITRRLEGIDRAFPDILRLTEDRLAIDPAARAMTRLVARYLDAYAAPGATSHSLAI